MADTAQCAQTESLLRGCSPACERPESRGELRLSSEQCIHCWWAVSRCFWARAPPKLLKARRASLVGAPKQPPPRGWRVTRVGVVPALEGKVSLESDRDRGLENQPEIGSDTHDRPRTSDIRRKCWFLTGLQVWMMFWWIYIWKYERRAVTWAWWYHGVRFPIRKALSEFVRLKGGPSHSTACWQPLLQLHSIANVWSGFVRLPSAALCLDDITFVK